MGKGQSQVPLISVIVPAYNHERYVETAVRSVLDQDWPRIELIVIDDGSGDGTWDVLQRLCPECERRLERVVMIRQENQGTCVTMNRLCQHARGDFAGLLASDDAYLPGAFRRLLEPMVRDDATGVVVGRNELMDGDGRHGYWNERQELVYDQGSAKYVFFNDFIRSYSGVDDQGPDFGSYPALLKVNHVANGAMIRKSALDKVLPFTKDAPLEDWWLHLQLSKVTRYATVPEPTFRYRWHATNTIRQRERMDRYYRQTLEWEERHVEGLADRRWREAFAEQYWDVRRKFALGNALVLEKVLSLRERRKVLTLFGHEFVLSRQPKDLI